MKKIFKLCLLILILVGCKKHKLKGDYAILEGNWKWAYSIKRTYNTDFQTTEFETIYASQYPDTYEVEFFHKGKMSFKKNGDEDEKYRIVFDYFSYQGNVPLVMDNAWFFIINLNNRKKNTYSAWVNEDTLSPTKGNLPDEFIDHDDGSDEIRYIHFYLRNQSLPAIVNPGNFNNGLKISGMGTHLYAIEWYNPFTGQQYPVIYKWSVAGALNLPYPTLESNLDHSILYFKVYKKNQSFLPQQITENRNEYVISTNENQSLDVVKLDGETQKNMTVHPNPANNSCMVSVGSVCGQQPKLVIYNLQGLLIEEINVTSKEIEIDLIRYACGIYFIRLNDDCGGDLVKLVKK